MRGWQQSDRPTDDGSVWWLGHYHNPPREGKRVKPWQRIGDCAGLLRSPMGDPGLWLVNASVRAAQTDQDDR